MRYLPASDVKQRDSNSSIASASLWLILSTSLLQLSEAYGFGSFKTELSTFDLLKLAIKAIEKTVTRTTPTITDSAFENIGHLGCWFSIVFYLVLFFVVSITLHNTIFVL
jgi:hypothetical protein